MIVEHPTIKVFKVPSWFKNRFRKQNSRRGTAVIIPKIDPDGNEIISKSILNDLDWNLDRVIGPNGQRKRARDWFEEIPYKYDTDTEGVQR